jgi:uncharacterized protein (DUF1684 family)
MAVMRKALTLAVAFASASTVLVADEAYRSAIVRWRAQREARLTADGGWLTVAGLFWLEQGQNRFGTDPRDEIVLPPGSAAAQAGVFELRGDETRVRLEPGVAASVGGKPVAPGTLMRPDSGGSPDVLEIGRLSLLVIERGGRYAIRVKDKESPARKSFSGLHWFDVDEKLRVDARWVPYDPPKPVKVPNVLGQMETMPSPGRAEFEIAGAPVALDGVLEEPGDNEIFFIFRDATSGHETYGAGRFLYAELPRGGRITLDFNKAYNPPCAFTPYATCPLPPPQNRLQVGIEAGEKTYGHGH